MRNEVKHRSEATLNSIPTNVFVKKLKAYPLGRILFITIRDPKQSERWCKIGKANDWIRRYSTCYFIVKGTNGGTHFHMLAGIEKNRKPIPVKGIHFHIVDLKRKQETLTIPDIQEVERGKFIAETIRNKQIIRMEIPFTCLKIAQMIKSYFLKKRNKEKADERKAKKQDDITRIIDYLFTNLNEPRLSDTRDLFLDYILKY